MQNWYVSAPDLQKQNKNNKQSRRGIVGQKINPFYMQAEINLSSHSGHKASVLHVPLGHLSLSMVCCFLRPWRLYISHWGSGHTVGTLSRNVRMTAHCSHWSYWACYQRLSVLILWLALCFACSVYLDSAANNENIASLPTGTQTHGKQ